MKCPPGLFTDTVVRSRLVAVKAGVPNDEYRVGKGAARADEASKVGVKY